MAPRNAGWRLAISARNVVITMVMAVMAVSCLMLCCFYVSLIDLMLGLKKLLGARPKPKVPLPNGSKRVLIVTDTSTVNICGVLRKFNELRHHLAEQGHEVTVIYPELYWSFSVPRYAEVVIPFPTPWMVYDVVSTIENFEPDAINLMTEGPLGIVCRVHCNNFMRTYTSMWCTRFDLYLESFGGAWAGPFARLLLSWFHARSSKVIMPSPSFGNVLKRGGLISEGAVYPILNGCNTEAFSVDGPLDNEMDALARPIWLYVGRVSHEKNIGDLLCLRSKLPGSIVVVGKGPDFDLHVEECRGENVHFLGWRQGDALSAVYRSADVFVFPSRTDTFGQVMVEAMASGLPVAAYPVTGPVDVVKHGVSGALDEDLYQACMQAHDTKQQEECVAHAKTFSWATMSQSFMRAQGI